MHLLADGDHVDEVAPTAADGFRKSRAEQAKLARRAVQLARYLTGAFPLVEVREHLGVSESADGLAQGEPLRRPERVGAHSSSSGISTYRERSHSPSAFACGSKRAL